MSLIVLIVIAAVVVALVATLILGGKKHPIPTGLTSPIPWQDLSVDQYADDLDGTVKTVFMPDGKSLIMSVKSDDAQPPNSLYVLQHQEGQTDTDRYPVKEIIGLPHEPQTPPTVTKNGTILLTGMAPQIIFAHNKYSFVITSPIFQLLDIIDSVVPYGDGAVINFDQSGGLIPPMLLKKIPSAPKPTASNPLPVVEVALEEMGPATSFGQRIKFVGATSKTMVFLLDGKFPGVILGDEHIVGQEDASVSLSVSGMRILAASPSRLVLYNESFEPIWSLDAEDQKPFMAAEVVANQVVFAYKNGNSAVLVRLVPSEDGRGMERMQQWDLKEWDNLQQWEWSPDLKFSVGKLGWIAVTNGHVIIAP